MTPVWWYIPWTTFHMCVCPLKISSFIKNTHTHGNYKTISFLHAIEKWKIETRMNSTSSQQHHIVHDVKCFSFIFHAYTWHDGYLQICSKHLFHFYGILLHFHISLPHFLSFIHVHLAAPSEPLLFYAFLYECDNRSSSSSWLSLFAYKTHTREL